MSDSAVLKQARESSGLGVEQAALLVGVDVAVLRSIEAGATSATPRVLDSFAKVFGLTLTEFLRGQAVTTVSSLLFRSFRDSGPTFQALTQSGALTTLGDFLRCVRATSELRALLGVASTAREKVATVVPTPTAPAAADLLAKAERLALSTRSALGLGTKPVESMRAVFDSMGIDVFYVTPDELDVDVDAASTATPVPAVLVNLVGGSEQWWRTRMTLAHELCHLLLDRRFFGDDARFVMLSPSTDRARSVERVGLPPPLELMEKRARAFAIHFLIPRFELERVLINRDPKSEAAVTTVCQHFMVGRIAAINQLRNVQLITDDDRTRMLGRHPASTLSAEHPDAGVGSTGLRAGILRELVLRALATGRISPVQARSYLEVPANECLPEAPGLSPELRAPLVTTTERVERVVVRRLASEVGLADCFIDSIEADGDTWRVEIMQQSALSAGTASSRGFLLVGPDLQILEEHLEARASA